MTTASFLIRIPVASNTHVDNAELSDKVKRSFKGCVEREDMSTSSSATSSQKVEWAQEEMTCDESADPQEFVIRLRSVQEDQAMLKIGQHFGVNSNEPDEVARQLAKRIEDRLANEAPGSFGEVSGHGFEE